MSSALALVVLLSVVYIRCTDAASVCFSLPATPAGAAPYTAASCGGAMPTTGYPIGTQCSTPTTGCASPSLSKATCLDGVSNNEGYWSQPICTVAATPGFSTTQAASTVVTTVANKEYASLVHLDDLYTTVSVKIGFNSGLADSNIIVNVYTLQDPVGAVAGPGDLLYTVSGSFVAAGGSTVSTSTGLEVVSTITDMTSGAGNLVIIFPTPLNFANDYFLSITMSAAGLVIPMECAGGPNVKQYWTRTSSSNPFVSTNVAGSGFACIADVVNVLGSQPAGPTCPPTLLTATIGYDGSSNSFDQNEPSMPYLDFTRSGFTGGPYLDLNFTFPTGVYDDIEFLPYSGAQAFGPPPAPITGGGGTYPPCGTTFQVLKQFSSNCESTATVRANFLQLISEDVSTTKQVCGWTLAPAPIQYQGIFYSQWSGTIQIVTYQTVALFGTVSLRIKEAYANVVVRSPIVTSNAIASPVAVTDAAIFQWSIVNQNLDSDSLPYQSITNLQTRVSAGYELSASAVISSASSPTPWTFANGLTSSGALTTSSAPCSGTTTPCTQSWQLVVENSDSAVCSLDGVVTVTYLTACNAQLISSGGCDGNVDGRTFVTTVVLSSVDFCRVVGGVTSLSMSVPTVQAPATSISDSTTFLTNAASSMFPAVPSIFVVGSSIGVYFTVSSQPQIPLTLSAVSAKIYDATDRSHFSLYADTTADSDGSGRPYYYVTMPPVIPGPTASAFFNLPTGDQGTGVVYTPWLLTNAGTVNNIIVSVTASVQYDNVLLGDTPHFITFDIPMTATLPSPPRSSSPLTALASKIQDVAPLSIVTGTITEETTLVSIQSAQEESSSVAMSTGAIAGVAAGSAALLIIIIIVVVAVMAKTASSAAAAKAKYAPPAAAAAAAGAGAGAASVGAPSAGPPPTASIKEDFFAPRVGLSTN